MQTQKHMKTVATAAVEAINLQNRQNAEAKAIVIVKDIVDLQKQVDAQEANIASLQTELAKVANSEITLAGVFGKAMPAALNATQQTVAKAIETLVKSKQGCVESRATTLGESIISCKKSIESLEEAMGKKRKELEDLKVEVVSEVDVLES